MKHKFTILFLICCLMLSSLALTGCEGADDIFEAIYQMSEGIDTPEDNENPAAGSPNPEKDTDNTNAVDFALNPQAFPTEETLQVYFIDVGQGDSALIVQGEEAMLIDTGERGSEAVILPVLRAAGAEEIDHLVLTHPHTDHIGSAQAILETFPVNQIYMPNFTMNTSTFEYLLDTIAAQGKTIIAPEPGNTIAVGDARVEFLGPVKSYEECNNVSLITKVTFGEISFLFTGDAEILAEEDLLVSGADVSAHVLKAAHHGSSSSNGETFLGAVNPALTVISCGKGNDYGHPHDQALSRLEAATAYHVYRTDEWGTVRITTDGKTLTEGLDADFIARQPARTDDGESYIGNINSQVIHGRNCNSLPKPENQIYYKNLEAAINNGYRPHQDCIK